MSGSHVLSVRSGRSTASGTPAACTTPPMVPMAATAVVGGVGEGCRCRARRRPCRRSSPRAAAATASAASAARSGWRSQIATGRPTSATACAVARPMPGGAAGDHDAGRGLELESQAMRRHHARSGRGAPVREKIARMTETFAAFTAEKTDDGFRRGVTELTLDDLPEGDVVVDVEWSSVNYKDHLAATEKGRVARISPIVPGIDLAGTVRSSDAAGIAAGRRGDRARLRPRRRPARWVRAGGAGAGGMGRAVARRSHRARGDGRRHRGLHRGALGARAARPRPRRRARARCWSPARPAAWAAWRWRCWPASGSPSPPAPARPRRRRSSAGSAPREIIDRDELTDVAQAAAVGPLGGCGRRGRRPDARARAGHARARRRGGGERQRRRCRPADDGAAVHPARRHAVRHRLRGHADRPSPRGVGAHRHRSEARRASTPWRRSSTSRTSRARSTRSAAAA